MADAASGELYEQADTDPAETSITLEVQSVVHGHTAATEEG